MSVSKKEMTKDGRSWVFRTRYVNLDGENKFYTSKKYKTKKEAQEGERLFLLSLTDKIDYNDMTFVDLYNKYVEFKQGKVKKNTMHSYNERWEYMKELRNIRVSNFNSVHYDMWRKKINELKIADVTKNDIQKFLKILLNFGMKWYNFNLTKIYNKIANFNDPDAPVKDEMLFFTNEEFKQFMSVEDDLIFQCAFNILYYCGLRRGELVGLRWNNVDFSRHEIKIRNNAVKDYENGGYAITSPKTKKSIRNVPMGVKLESMLKQLKEQSEKVYGYKNDWFVIGYDEPMPFGRLNDRKNRNCELAGVKQIRLHDFRHSCASLLISKGANITLVARYLGHTKIDETLNTYSHFFKSDLFSLIDSIDESMLY